MTAVAGSPLLICRHSAWTSAAAACLETLLTAGVFEQRPVLVLLDAAVTLLIADQHGEVIHSKTLARQMPALELYGIETVYADPAALLAYGVNTTELVLPIQLLAANQLAGLVAAASTALVF